MSFVDNTGIRVFPTSFIKDCIEKYTKSHGKKPKILVISSEDYLDYTLSCTMLSAEALGLEKIIVADYLKPGEMDLAIGIKNETT